MLNGSCSRGNILSLTDIQGYAFPLCPLSEVYLENFFFLGGGGGGSFEYVWEGLTRRVKIL